MLCPSAYGAASDATVASHPEGARSTTACQGADCCVRNNAMERRDEFAFETHNTFGPVSGYRCRTSHPYGRDHRDAPRQSSRVSGQLSRAGTNERPGTVSHALESGSKAMVRRQSPA